MILDSILHTIVDIHFQYNIMMQGVLIYSVYAMKNNRFLVGAFTYSVLLNMKHIYLYAAPVYFFYIVKHYVLENKR